ncbi:hypothetical protein QJS10_CPB20g01689 [Acorus calamus]|uniref:Delta(3)-Delta(2)-enoyl-CoA isomerase n=1 Tax=Acorus calamus TaxID=4465 RepID=A0AAV9CAK2_ACOCL|nr:hypothetical protein QJS10_CPB20g01689 [Acorus calamus]
MCTLEKRGKVFHLILTGPDEQHRLNPTTIDSIRSALAQIRSDSTPGSALVTSADGRFFSNGFDLAWASSPSAGGSDPAVARRRLGHMVSLFSPLVADLLSLPMPTIAAVTGHAAAAGFALAVCHDYVLMRKDKGFLYMSEIDLGLPLPGYFMALLRSKIVNPMWRREVTMRGARVSADRAVEMGIVDSAHGGAGETIEAALGLGEELSKRGWDGHVYASMRVQSLPEVCGAVGLGLDGDGKVEREEIGIARL